jgi:sugar/nucleoside kinase (ribokinase family)
VAEIVCVGILIADVFASPVDSLPAAGELALMDRYLLSAGGCASNTAADLRRLGRTASVVGKIGTDLFGDFVLNDLGRLGIDTSFVKRSRDYPTSCTLILNVRGEDRRYVHCFGANVDFSLGDIDLDALDGARALYVGGYFAMPAFRPERLAELFRDAKSRGLMTALDVVIPAGLATSLEDIRQALTFTDVFLPNLDEARVLTGQTDPIDQAEALARLNPDCAIVITLGKTGAIARKRDRILRAGSFKVNSIDESGGGDAFSAGFLVSMLENWSLEDSLRFASAVGASCTTALGCHDGVFRFDEALAFISRNKLPLEKVG